MRIVALFGARVPRTTGLRITVELILNKISEGASEHDLLDAYPGLAEADIKAAVAYTATKPND